MIPNPLEDLLRPSEIEVGREGLKALIGALFKVVEKADLALEKETDGGRELVLGPHFLRLGTTTANPIRLTMITRKGAALDPERGAKNGAVTAKIGQEKELEILETASKITREEDREAEMRHQEPVVASLRGK